MNLTTDLNVSKAENDDVSTTENIKSFTKYEAPFSGIFKLFLNKTQKHFQALGFLQPSCIAQIGRN